MSNITAYHAKYFAHELTRQLPSNDIGKLTASLHDAQVDLNPHQVEAALFAFKSPLSYGAILADEVGLGKTIEAGIILSQQWAEHKRKLLIICPANLRKQWNQELQDKFFLPSVIIENKSFNEEINKENLNPFIQKNAIVICSFQFAKAKAPYLKQTDWDLVIIDEAHRLRNVYKPTNKIANIIKDALYKKKKVLLTATPLQNSILELYGLVSVIDDFVFGDLKSFKSQYSKQLDEEDYTILKGRLQSVCMRTLRRQVLEYIKYTKRIAIREEFFPTDEEQKLYEWVSEYLQRPKLYALPSSQRQLMTLILRKLLASSTYAIYGTLDKLVTRLELLVNKNKVEELDLGFDFEGADEIEDEWLSEEDEAGVLLDEALTKDDIIAIEEEIVDLKKYRGLAEVIRKNSKAEHLFIALKKGFDELKKLGANQKALIFTESRRTQDFIAELLEIRGYKGKVVLFNGTNSDAKSNAIYKAWQKEHKGSDKITGSATADKRAALVDYFRDEATIMIATEAAAEGINLQFCSLIVNYDLPWNPQRIEQRIGRCHRYGQRHDVVVVNFLNKKNAADIRVYELLDEKFRLFDGVFGSSDEVLGSIGNGVDFEKRIAQIYNDCRTTEEISLAFDILQEELQGEISDKMIKARSSLLENFDEAVREKLKLHLKESQINISKFEQRLWKVTHYFLGGKANFTDNKYSFLLKENPFPGKGINLGQYCLVTPKEGEKKSDIKLPDNAIIYRSGHPLAQHILQACKEIDTPVREVIFDYTNTPTKITLLEKLIGETGWMRIDKLAIQSFEHEDYLLTACVSNRGKEIHHEVAERMFSLYAVEGELVELPAEILSYCKGLIKIKQQEVISENATRSRYFFDEEIDKLDTWAEDMKLSLEKEIKDLDSEIRLRKSEAKKMLNLETKVKAQREIKELEKKRYEKRKSLFEAQDEIDEKKDILLTDVEKMLSQKIEQREIFTINWKIV